MTVTQGTVPGLSVGVNGNNQITNSGFSYDPAGHLTGDGSHTYQWDAEGRLTKITQGSNTYSNNIYNAQGWGVETFWPIYGNMVQGQRL